MTTIDEIPCLGLQIKGWWDDELAVAAPLPESISSSWDIHTNSVVCHSRVVCQEVPSLPYKIHGTMCSKFYLECIYIDEEKKSSPCSFLCPCHILFLFTFGPSPFVFFFAFGPLEFFQVSATWCGVGGVG